ncbi:MAG: 4-hydroxy-tetrahydrodipicolinate synthase [Tardiphaga sp.]|nr:4-hydroxy-tetrahydrodipicolinate synthase [Tardiphaga sp.]
MTSALDHPWLAGFIADLPTPFDDNDAVDLAAFELLCERQVAAGATALVVGETAGEAATLSMDEHHVIIRTAVTTARGRAKVITGAGSNATNQAITLTQRAEAAGADAVLSVVPYYNKPMQAGIEAHFRAIADATALPVILHDVPSRTLRSLADETLLRLAESPQFVGLRDGSGDITRPLRLRAMLPPGFRLLSGDDATAMAFLLQGGDGCISTIANIAPKLCREVFCACKQNQPLYAATITDRLAPLNEALPRDATPASIKYALSLLNLSSPRVRLPMVGLAGPEKIAITQAMAIALGP